MRVTLTVFLLTLFSTVSAQEITERITYLDSAFVETNQFNRTYYLVISDQKKNKPPYKAIQYYKSGRVYFEGNSAEKNYLSRVGQFTEYYESGAKKALVTYKEGIELGTYLSWYENGNPQIVGEYIESGIKDDKHTVFKINQFWNSENIQTITDGNGLYHLTDDTLHEEGTIKDGFREGMWQGSDNVFHYSYIEKYADNKLVSGVSTDAQGIKRIYREIEVKPDFQGGINEFYRYVMRNFIPPQKPTPGGKIFISFYIEADGSVDDIKIIRGLDAEFNQEAYRMLAACPDWISGKKRGIPIRVRYSLPINIHMQD